MSRIFFVCPTSSVPTGGVQQIYRQVEVLNRYGFEAAVLHGEEDYRPHWFSHNATIAYDPRFHYSLPMPDAEQGAIAIAPEDYLVFPEVWPRDRIEPLSELVNHIVIYNQGAYCTFYTHSDLPDDSWSPYHSPKTRAILTVSEDSADYLRYGFPHLPVHQIRHGIDGDLFAYRPMAEKEWPALLINTKQAKIFQQVLYLLSGRGGLLEENQIVIANKIPRADLAAAFQKTAIFLWAGNCEGFGLPVAEAMACGCVVVGFHGGGARQLMQADRAVPIEGGNVLAMAQAVEQLLVQRSRDPAPLAAMGQRAAQYIREVHSLDQEARSILQAWAAILGNALPTKARQALDQFSGQGPTGAIAAPPPPDSRVIF
ncbi:MAG: glycosyltransferase family 4 protein [Cyanobacteria bacterium]|nr:glycosyltransferase family 4 protein [Cyanobacteriota bacterium]